jgi:type I restriction enzyme S subunit
MTDLPGGWESADLGDLAVLVRGVSFKKQEVSKTPAGGLVPVVRAGNVQRGLLDLEEDLVWVPETRVAPDQYLRKSDIVVATSSGSLSVVGKSARVPYAWLGAHGAFMSVVRPSEVVHPSFLYWWLQTDTVRRRWSEASAGTNINNLKVGTLTATPVPLPPMREQERIVRAIEEYLSRLDAAQSSLSSARHRLTGLTRRMVDLALDGEFVPLSELLREPLRNGLSAPASPTGSIRVATLTAVTRSSFVEENTKLIEPGARSVDDLWMQDGDIFIERSNTPELVGTAALYEGPHDWAIFPDLLIRVRVDLQRVDPAYLTLVLRSTGLRRYFQQSAQGIAGSMPKISQPIVEEAAIPLPTLQRQRAVLRELEGQRAALDRTSAEVSRSEARSSSLRRSVLAAAFSGQLATQDSDDEPASELLKRIRLQRMTATPTKRNPKVKA